MAKTKQRNKKYVPKPNDPVTIRFSEQDEQNFQLMPHLELTNLKHGHGTDVSWDTLELRLKWGHTLALQKGLAAVQEPIQAAIGYLREVHQRFKRVEKYGVSGDESSAIGQALNLADELQLTATRRELRDALNRTLLLLKKTPEPTGRINCFAA